MNKELWEILVPKTDNNGFEYTIAYHNVWDEYVKSIAGGLTIMRSAKGIWDSGKIVYEERMIPVRVACYREDLEKILAYTKKYYEQEAIFATKISEEVVIYS